MQRKRILVTGAGGFIGHHLVKRLKKVQAVMLGVGAAFDFHAERVPQAPGWMQRMGLEWLFRLVVEPRRLWRRYLKHNPRFVILVMMQLLGLRRFKEA